MKSVQLVPIDQSGEVTNAPGALPELVLEIAESMTYLYAANGYLIPWVGYVAWADTTAVGTCAFKTSPKAGTVEIAYFTFPDFEGQGVATEMARGLVRIAQTTDPTLLITAQTLPETNASTAILKKLGFDCVDTVVHPEDGEVWEWHLAVGNG